MINMAYREFWILVLMLLFSLCSCNLWDFSYGCLVVTVLSSSFNKQLLSSSFSSREMFIDHSNHQTNPQRVSIDQTPNMFDMDP